MRTSRNTRSCSISIPQPDRPDAGPRLDSIDPAHQCRRGGNRAHGLRHGFNRDESAVYWNDQKRQPTFIDPNTLRATILRSDVAQPGGMPASP